MKVWMAALVVVMTGSCTADEGGGLESAADAGRSCVGSSPSTSTDFSTVCFSGRPGGPCGGDVGSAQVCLDGVWGCPEGTALLSACESFSGWPADASTSDAAPVDATVGRDALSGDGGMGDGTCTDPNPSLVEPPDYTLYCFSGDTAYPQICAAGAWVCPPGTRLGGGSRVAGLVDAAGCTTPSPTIPGDLSTYCLSGAAGACCGKGGMGQVCADGAWGCPAGYVLPSQCAGACGDGRDASAPAGDAAPQDGGA